MTAVRAAPARRRSIGWTRSGRRSAALSVRTGDRIELASLAVLLVAWEVVPRVVELQWLPPLSSVLGALADIQRDGVLMENLSSSLGALAKGLALAVVLGLGTGALMAHVRLVEVALNAYVDVLLFTPSLVFAPVFFALFGLGDQSRIAVIVVYAAPVIVVNTMTALKSADRQLMEMARSFGMSHRRILVRIQLPASLPLTLEGVRLALGRGIKGMVTGEVLIALTGLGGLASTYGDRLAVDRVWAITLVIMAIAVVSNWLFTRLETRLTRWVD